MVYLIAAIALLWYLDPLQARIKKPPATSAEAKAVQRVNRYAIQIKAAAEAAGVSPQLLSAIVYVESKGVAAVKRTEPDGRVSYGLTQILCSTAQELGFTGKCIDLFSPSVNLKWGAEYLKSRLNLYGLDLGILSYNTGSPQHDSRGNLYDPNNYIYKVKAAYDYFA